MPPNKAPDTTAATKCITTTVEHHDPYHDDEFMDEVARQAAEEWDGAFVAKEGMKLDI